MHEYQNRNVNNLLKVITVKKCTPMRSLDVERYGYIYIIQILDATIFKKRAVVYDTYICVACRVGEVISYIFKIVTYFTNDVQDTPERKRKSSMYVIKENI